jgi:hypothetical protein
MLAGVIGLLWGRVSNLNNSFMDMYSSGVVFTGGMSQLNNAAAASGLGLEKFTALMNKNSAVAVNLGTQRTVALSKSFMLATRRGVDLGMTMEEAQQTMFDYAENMRLTGQLRDMSDDELIAGTKEYGMQLNSIAQLTGKRIDQVRAEIQEATKNANVQVMLNSLAPEQRKAMTAALAEFRKAGDAAGELQDMTVRYVARGFSGMTETQRQMIQQAGLQREYEQYVQALMRGDIATSDRMLGELSKGFTALSGRLGSFNLLGPQGEVAAASASFGASTRNAAENLNRVGIMRLPEDVAAMTAATNEMNVAIQSLSASFSALALPIVRVIAPAFELLASLVTRLTSAFGIGAVDEKSAEGPGGAYTMANMGNAVGAAVVLLGTVFFGAVTGFVFRMVKSLIAMGLGATLGRIPGIGKLGMPTPPNLGGMGGAADSVSKTARGFNGIGAGTGGTIRSVMRGLASGFVALGNPRALMGIVGVAGVAGSLWIAGKAVQEFSKVDLDDLGKAGIALAGLAAASAGLALAGAAAAPIALGGAAIGGALGAIGLGLAGAAWLLGNTLPTLAEGITKFTEMDGENLEKVGIGMAGIGAGLLAIGASPVASAVGSFVGWISSLFGAKDPIDRLKRFEQLAGPLSKAAPALTNFSNSFSSAIRALNGSILTEDVVRTMDQLKELLSLDEGGFFGGSPAVIGQLNDLAEAIGNVADKTVNLQNAARQPETPQTSAIDMQKRTIEFYDNQRTSNSSMIALLQAANQKLDTLNTSVTDGSTETVRAIRRGGNNLL